MSEHWKELVQYLGVDPRHHWDILEESSDADEKCHGVSVYWLVCAYRRVFCLAHLLQLMVLILFLQVLLLWLNGRRATLQELLEAVESTSNSAAAGSLQQLIERACFDGQH